MNEYPRMLYRCPGSEQIHGGAFSTLIVGDADACDAAVAEGWFLTTPEAREDYQAKQNIAAAAAPVDVASADAAPTREELEQKAAELGLEFDGRTSDKKLRAKIDAALAK